MSIDPNRPYRGTAHYYAEYRQRITPTFAHLVAARLHLTDDDRLLDLGSGPGVLSERFSPYAKKIIAVDPEPDMLDEGRRRCTAAGVENVTFVRASSDDLSEVAEHAPFRAVLVGQAFHWMRPHDAVLRRLDGLVSPDGAVVLVSPEVMTHRPSWWGDVEALFKRYLAGSTTGDHPSGRQIPFADVVRRSAFPVVEELRLEYEAEEQPSLQAALGLWYSLSWVLDRLGDRRADLEAEARERLAWIDDLPTRIVRHRDVALFGLRLTAP